MKKIFVLLIVVCFTMCKQKMPLGENTIFVDIDHPENASLFDYFSSIELIPLETSPDVLMTCVAKIVIHQDRYYMFDVQQSIFLVFNKTGKFLFKIDKKGQGPGEYSFIRDFNLNLFSNNLELLEPYGKLHVFDLSGNYIETKRVTFPGFRVVHQFAVLDSRTHVFYTMFQPKKIIYFNFDENKLLHEEFEENGRLGSFPTTLYQFQDDWYFYRPVHPVVYKLGKERLEVAFQFDFGTYAKDGTNAFFSKEAERSIYKASEELFAQFSYLIHSVRHNNKYVLVSLSRNDMDLWANIIYNKATGESKFIPDFMEHVLFNSHRGEEIIVTDEFVLMPVQWGDLEKYIQKEMLDETQKKIFNDLISAKMELNPVLIKYWFK